VASIAKRPNGRWRARYRDLDGREHARHFDRKVAAQRWLDTVTTDLVTGRYVDPRGGRTTLRAFAERWFEAQTFDAGSRQTVRPRLTVHIYPHLGDVELRQLRPSTVQAWLRGRQADLAPSYVAQLLTTLSAVLSAAVEDGLIASNPCAASSVRAPRVERRQVVPWSVELVQAITEAHDDRWRAMPVLAAGCGLRQGEVLGLRLEDVDFLRRKIHVRRQVRLLGGRPVFAPPKGGKEREVPLPDLVAVALSEHLRTWPASEVTLPWRDLDGAPRTETLVFARDGQAINRNEHNRTVWRPAIVAAGVTPSRDTGMHALRHHYASLLLDGGVSIRALAEYLGHHDPGFTLRTYAHMMPTSDSRARQAVDAAHAPADSPRTGAEVPS
jgi:integrase